MRAIQVTQGVTRGSETCQLRRSERTAIELDALRRRLARDGRIQLPDVLEDSCAQRLAGCLEAETPWGLAVRLDGESRYLDNSTVSKLDANELSQISSRALEEPGFSFAYRSFQMVTSYLANRQPGFLLHDMVEFLNSPDFIQFARVVTGDERIRRLDGQATCYSPGHFLTTHDDNYEDEGRLYAYVLNLTRQWKPDWGGELQFVNQANKRVAGYMPAWNVLNVFRVPTDHRVSMVTDDARQPRLSITGWMRS